MHSVADLTTFSRQTTGDVPPKLVGASTTVVGDKMFLFGGRLVAERRMVADMYCFDLETFVWEKILPTQDEEVPGARYFHSADTWNNFLVVFGGMGHAPDSDSPDDLCVLNDVRFFDLTTRSWQPVPAPSSHPPSPAPVPETSDEGAGAADDSLVPRGRYAHLSAITATRLFVIGGQDLNNVWLDDVCVFDLAARAWVLRRAYPRHSGTYRSIAVAAALRVRHPQEEAAIDTGAGAPGTRFAVDKAPPADAEFTAPDAFVHLPYSTEATDEFPNEIFLYSNYNFTDVKRELEVFTPRPDGGFDMDDRSASMGGTALPPGLRFPTGAVCGNHLIFAGTYLANSYQSFSIWALDLQRMTWARIEPGSALARGAWFRGCLWAPPCARARFVVFGSRVGSLVEDYNRRLLSWEDVAYVDLEAFGIYQPPRAPLEPRMQALGLAALEEHVLADFELVCDDGRRIPCARRVLEARWPWFATQRARMLAAATRALEALPPSASDVGLPLPASAAGVTAGDGADEVRADPRLAPRTLVLSEPYPVTLALLQYFYALALITPLQHAPAVLSQLLLLSANYDIPHLRALVQHAMHRALSPSTSVGVYEVATLCGCQSLQIRALKAVMASSRRSTGSQRTNSSGGAGGGGDGGGGNGGGGGGGNGGGGGGGRDNSTPNHAARPRGMSDVRTPSDRTMASGRSNTVNDGQTNGRQTSNAGARDDMGLTWSPGVRRMHQPTLSMDSLYQVLQTVASEMITSAEELDPVLSRLVRNGRESALEGLPSPPLRSPSPSLQNRPLYPRSQSPGPRSHSPALRSRSPDVHNHPPMPRRPHQGSPSSTIVDHYRLANAIYRSRSTSALSVDVSDQSSASNASSLASAPYPPSAWQRAHPPDSDARSLSSSTSMSSLGSVYRAHRARGAPNSPESPALLTPDDAYFPGVGVAPTLSAIDERPSFEDPDQQPGKASLETLKMQGLSRRDGIWPGEQQTSQSSSSEMDGSPISSPTGTLRTSVGAHGGDVAPSPTAVASTHKAGTASTTSHPSPTSERFPPRLSSPSTLKAEKEAAKARAKADKLEQKAREKAERDRTKFESSIWKDSREDAKAAKLEAKRRKKEEERAKIERLASDLKARARKEVAPSIQGGLSLQSGSSGGKVKAHEWVENSGGLYGGLSSWGGL